MSACTHCNGTGQEPVHRWTEADELDRAVREEATASTRLEVDVVREPKDDDDDGIVRGWIGFTQC